MNQTADSSHMTDRLLTLYFSKWTELCEAIKPILNDSTLEVKPANPLLLTVTNGVDTADIRLMIYGQETNSWDGLFNARLDTTIDCYDRFFNRGECWSYGGQFWPGVSRFIAILQAKYPDKTIFPIWNNIVKMGKHGDKGFPPDYIYEIERKYFSIINDELQIIKPNVVLFLTGPNYDAVIKDNFGQVKYEAISPFTERWLSKVELKNIDYAFRTYHPNFLWRNDINAFYSAIVSQINI